MKQIFWAACLCVLSNILYSQKIFDAIKEGDLKYVESWIEKGKDLDKFYLKADAEGKEFNIHPFAYAVYFYDAEMVNLFIENRYEFTNFNDLASAALGMAIQNCNEQAYNILIDQGADIDYACRTCGNTSPISISVKYNCFSIYELLMAKGALLENKQADYNIIHTAAETDSLKFLQDLIIDNNLDVNLLTPVQTNAAFFAANSGKLENLKFLISKGCQYDILDIEGLGILSYANDVETFKYLEDLLINSKGLKKEDLVNPNKPLIYQIILSDNAELFDYYLERYGSFPLNKKGKYDYPPTFMLLYIKNNTEYFLNELIRRKVKLDAEDKNGKTLKYWAKRLKNKELLDAIKSIEDKKNK
jgi:ankyrin repeat protein